MIAMKAGSGPGGGGALLPGSVVQATPQPLAGFRANPLKAAGAAPPVRMFRLDHCAPQNVTTAAAILSPTTNAPPRVPNPNTSVVAEALLFVGVRIGSSAVTLPPFETVPTVVALRVIVMVALRPLVRFPRLQLTVVLHVPWLDVAEIKVVPAGTGSLTTTLVAPLGPPFMTVNV